MQNQDQNSLTLSAEEVHYMMRDAVEEKKLFLVKMLLRAGANVNARPEYEDGEVDNTYLKYAVMNDHPEMVKTLIEAGAEVNSAPSEGEDGLYRLSSPLMVAVDMIHINLESVETVRLLLEAGADVEAVGTDGNNVYDMILVHQAEEEDGFRVPRRGRRRSRRRREEIKQLIYLNRLQRYQDRTGLALLQRRQNLPSDVYNFDINPFL